MLPLPERLRSLTHAPMKKLRVSSASDTHAATDGGEDFAALLAQYDKPTSLKLQPGDRVRAKVVHFGKEDVFFELSPTQEGVMPRAEVMDAEGKVTVAAGDVLEVFVARVGDQIELSRKVGRDQIDVELLQRARETQLPIEGTITAVNKGGLEVQLGGSARGFCPMGQVDVNFVEDVQKLIGQTLQFVVRDVREGGRNVVLSRRALLEADRKAKAQVLRGSLEVGQRMQGKVTRIADFGVFVDLGGIDGMIPLGALAYERVERAEDVVHTGDVVDVEITRLEDDPKRPGQLRVGLSRRATLADPLTSFAVEHPEGTVLTGKVTKLETFGAFVEVAPGLDGLVHVSELSHKRVRHPSDVVEVGQELTVKLLSIDAAKRRIALSLKQASASEAPQSSGESGRVGGGASTGQLAQGTPVEGTVERIEKYGVFVQLEGGKVALMPAAETGTEPGTDLTRAFPVGSKVALQVLGTNERGQLRVSKKARERAEERTLVEDYNRTSGAGKGFGTFGDLLKKSAK